MTKAGAKCIGLFCVMSPLQGRFYIHIRVHRGKPLCWIILPFQGIHCPWVGHRMIFAKVTRLQVFKLYIVIVRTQYVFSCAFL
jgi:hypothetical protein